MSELARSFDRAAEEYERGRPGYAEAALDALGLPADRSSSTSPRAPAS